LLVPIMSGGLTERSRGEEAVWWAALQQVKGVGAGTMLRLARVFGSPEAAAAAPCQELMARGRLSASQAAQVSRLRESAAMLRDQIAAWQAHGIKLLSCEDPRYPGPLRDLRSPPPLLYLRGELRAADAHAVAVVGTREPEPHAARLARALARGLAERGFTIVSGLARGIDTAAHRGTLATPKGRTIAVLGSGLLRIYPPEKALLAARIAKRRCVMAEVPPETEVERGLLLARDRIQAALSQAVIVVQAYPECGSVVTARHAVRCGRLLFAIPWSQGTFAEGWKRLQKMGAKPIEQDLHMDALVAEIEASAPGPEHRPLL